MREQRLELVGIYHSHPTGENVPSQSDSEKAFYPEAAYVIVSPMAGIKVPVRAFRLAKESWQEIEVTVTGAA
jgi:proteasome lid subunit RPN8/RPN11